MSNDAVETDDKWRLMCEQQVDKALGTLNEHYPLLQQIVEQGGAITDGEKHLQEAAMRTLMMVLTLSKVEDDYFFSSGDAENTMGTPPCGDSTTTFCASCEHKEDCVILTNGVTA